MWISCAVKRSDDRTEKERRTSGKVSDVNVAMSSAAVLASVGTKWMVEGTFEEETDAMETEGDIMVKKKKIAKDSNEYAGLYLFAWKKPKIMNEGER